MLIDVRQSEDYFFADDSMLIVARRCTNSTVEFNSRCL